MASPSKISNNKREGDTFSEIPIGWLYKETVDGGRYVNEIGQEYETKEDLFRYVKYAQKNKLSIYAPDYKSGEFSEFWGYHGPQRVAATAAEETPKEKGGKQSGTGSSSAAAGQPPASRRRSQRLMRKRAEK